DNVTRLVLALDRGLRFTGLSVEILANMGAYLSNFAPEIPTFSGAVMYSGVYAIPAIHVAVKGVFTNTVPVDAYRGAGRPEAAYALERLIDVAARRLGVSADELRRRNFLKTAAPAARAPCRWAAPRWSMPPTSWSPRARRSPRICWKRLKPILPSRMGLSRLPAPTAM